MAKPIHQPTHQPAPQPQAEPEPSEPPATELSTVDRLEFMLVIEQFRAAQMGVENARLQMQLAQMRLDGEKIRLKNAYGLRDSDQVDSGTGRIMRTP